MQTEAIEPFAQAQAMLEVLPGWVIAGGAAILAILVGIWAHRVFVRVAGRAVQNAHPVVRSLFNKTAGPARLAFILLAIWLVMPLMPAAGISDVFGTLFMAAVIGLIGWAAINATELGAELYLKGFDGKSADDPMARMHETLVRVLQRCAAVVIVFITAAFALMTFDVGREIGFSLFGTAGLFGLVVAFAAYTNIKSLIAGVQLALTQPLRIGDTVEVEGQTGQVDDITASHVVIRHLHGQRLIVPLYVFMEKPFQRVTRENAGTVGTLSIQTDCSVPVERVREQLHEIVRNDPLWDGRLVNLQVMEAKDGQIELRATVSARSERDASDLRYGVREKLVSFLQREYPVVRPRRRRGPVVRVYFWNGTWVFDDPSTGRVREPFGTSDIIRRAARNVANAERGFLAAFSDAPSPTAQVVLDWVGASGDGNRYRWAEAGLKDWLSPALTQYYEKAPKQLYMEVRALAP